MALVGSTYIQPSSSDPGAVGFGYKWAQTDTANLYYRNSGNTAWVLAGNTDQTYMGLLNRGGGTMTGAILGAHGLMPVSGGDFTVAPTILGDAIATVPYVNTQMTNLSQQLNVQIAQAIASIPALSISSKLAIGIGTSGNITMSAPGPNMTGTYTIPLPVYGDGTTAQQSEVTGRYWAWPINMTLTDGAVASAHTSYSVAETPANSRIFTLTVSTDSGVTPNASPYSIGYVIIGVKS